MSVYDEHWSAVSGELHDTALADPEAPKPKRLDGSLPKWKKFRRFETAVSAAAMGDDETEIELAVCIDYREGTFWVEAVFNKDKGHSHAFDVLRSTDEYGACDVGETLHWRDTTSQQRVILRLLDHGAAALPHEEAAARAVDGLKRLEAALTALVRERRY
jgi:hypothetical protein